MGTFRMRFMTPRQSFAAADPGARQLLLDARGHHRKVHRLDHIIVGAAVQSLHHPALAILCGEHDYGKIGRRVRGSEQPQQIQTPGVVQRRVKQHQIVFGLFDLLDCRRAIADRVHLVTPQNQSLG